jgi:hypothetical protein
MFTTLGVNNTPLPKDLVGYWEGNTRLHFQEPEPEQLRRALNHALLIGTNTALRADLVLLTVPDEQLHDYSEGRMPSRLIRHHLGPTSLMQVPDIITTQLLPGELNFMAGNVAGLEHLGTIGHVRLIGPKERLAITDQQNQLIAQREDAKAIMDKMWYQDVIWDAGIPNDQAGVFTRLVGVWLGFGMPGLKSTQMHPWLNSALNK